MSCSICRLPFVPAPISVNPLPAHFAPKGFLSPSQEQYFFNGVGMGRTIMGSVQSMKYCSANLFNGTGYGIIVATAWETDGKTVFVMHTVCARLLRRIFDCEDETAAAYVTLCGIPDVLGPPQGGAAAGSFKIIDYRRASQNIDLDSLWRQGESEGHNTFDWDALAREHKWLRNRPDVFPKFYHKIDPARLPVPSSEDNIFTKQPIDILHVLLSHLPIPSYLALTSTCRQFRYAALTVFQPHARALVMDLQWAVPSLPELAGKKAEDRAMMASESTISGDWMLYLSHVHRTGSMRVRRWVWGICEEMRGVYLREFDASPLACDEEGGKSAAMKALEQSVGSMFGLMGLGRTAGLKSQ